MSQPGYPAGRRGFVFLRICRRGCQHEGCVHHGESTVAVVLHWETQRRLSIRHWRRYGGGTDPYWLMMLVELIHTDVVTDAGKSRRRREGIEKRAATVRKVRGDLSLYIGGRK